MTEKKITNIQLFLLSLPAIIVLIIFKYIPMFGIYIAFINYKPLKGIFGSAFVGLQNFKFFFSDPQAIRIVIQTLLYNLTFLVVGTVAGVTLGILLYETNSKLSTKFYQTVFFLPFFLSWVAVSVMLYGFLQEKLGIANHVLTAFGIQPVSWYADKDAWPYILVVMHLWKIAGNSCLIYFAALSSLDTSLFEQASIDGCRPIQRIFHISLPHLAPVVAILVIISAGKLFFADFELFYQLPLQIQLLRPTTEVINTYVYRALINFHDYGMSSAVGVVQSVLGFVLVIMCNTAVSRMTKGEARLF